jgi:branched-chain amino acid transport system ATP-binding protein
VSFKGREIAGRKAFEVANLGIGYVPENRDIFPGLTTRQNLILGLKPGQKDGAGRWSMQDMFSLFENLERRADVEASVLSGGEQQMLTMCRTLMGDPDLIMIDEPTEGLSPQMVQRVAELLQEIARRGIATLLVEQKLSIALDIAHRVYVMGHGKVVFEGTPAELKEREDVRKEWLEV